MSAPWYEKYRPSTLDEYVWADERTKTKLVEWIENPLESPHLILTGSTGTGKTTLALIIRRMLDLGGDAKFIPASLRSGADTIRDEIVGFCEAGGFGAMKLIIFDEADRLSRDAQEMMRNVMDRYLDDVRFIFTCNNIDRLAEPLQGRSWVVKIQDLDEGAFLDRLVDIAVAENIDLEHPDFEDQITQIVGAFYPNMRGAISELQRSTVNGVLTTPEGDLSMADWHARLADLFASFSMTTAREMVSAMRVDQYETVYRALYTAAESLFGDQQGEAIILIADHLYRHSQAGLPDITLCACMIKLSELTQ